MHEALRIFLVVSGDVSGQKIKFFWPPVSDKSHKAKTDTNITRNQSHEQKASTPTSKRTKVKIASIGSATAVVGLGKSKSHPLKASTPRNAAIIKKDITPFTIEQEFYIYGIPLAALGDVLFPNHRYHHKIFELKIDDILYISFPFCWNKKERRTEKLHGFNIVFAINLSMHFNRLTEQNKKMWFDLIIKYVRIVQHEERRIAYLSSQLETMQDITKSVIDEMNERKKEKQDDPKAPKINTKSIGSKEDYIFKQEIYDVVSTVLTEICQKCPMANDIKRIQEILSVNDEIKLLVNGWVELHCSLKPPEEDLIIRPYHTLLLLPQHTKHEEEEKHDDVNNLRCIRKDAYDLLQQMPISGSQSLRLMISTANICSSFGDMASVTNIPLPTLIHFALHLKYWGKAQIIKTINKSSQFAIHSNANFSLIGAQSIYQKQFAQAFPHRKSLMEALMRFNHPQPLSQMIANDKLTILKSFTNASNAAKESYLHKQDFIFLIAWMLQRKLIVRLHRYIKYVNVNTDGSNHKAVRATNSKLHAIFENIKEHLNGENHFLEVMFQTGLSSSKLQLVIDEFEDQLITYWHPQD